MRNVLRRRVKTFYLAWIVLAVAVWMPAYVPNAHAASSWEGHPAHRAVWRLVDAERTRQASAFAVGPRLIVTVAHTLFNMVQAGAREFVIDQSGREGHIKVARTRSISATHDLALLETAIEMKHYLTVARTLPYGLADQFHAPGYPAGKFETVSVIAHTLHGDVDYFDLPMDRIVPSGMSGSPVLAPNGEVIAMLRTSNENVTGGVRSEFLNQLVEGDLGVSCGALGLTACLDKATEDEEARRGGRSGGAISAGTRAPVHPGRSRHWFVEARGGRRARARPTGVGKCSFRWRERFDQGLGAVELLAASCCGTGESSGPGQHLPRLRLRRGSAEISGQGA